MVPRRLRRWLSVALFAIAFAVPGARGEVWYDATKGSLPEAQGWTFFTLPPVSATFSDGAALFDTTATTLIRGGWTRIASPALVRADGVSLKFTIELVAESHVSTDRAGFSVILLDQDRRGIELGFWTDRVWAQSDVPLFTHAEERVFATSGRPAQYALTLLADHYELLAEGELLLTGPVRDYTAFSGIFDVYETPNFIFLGDDRNVRGEYG